MTLCQALGELEVEIRTRRLDTTVRWPRHYGYTVPDYAALSAGAGHLSFLSITVHEPDDISDADIYGLYGCANNGIVIGNHRRSCARFGICESTQRLLDICVDAALTLNREARRGG